MLEWEGSLGFAAWAGDVNMARDLLANGADPNERHSGGVTPLMLVVDEPGDAFDRDSFEVLRSLLDSGADVQATDDRGSTALHYAVRANLTAVEELLIAGADPEATNLEGSTPLHWAVGFSNVEVIRSLMDFGAHPHAKDAEGQTARDLAEKEAGLHPSPEADEVLKMLRTGRIYSEAETNRRNMVMAMVAQALAGSLTSRTRAVFVEFVRTGIVVRFFLREESADDREEIRDSFPVEFDALTGGTAAEDVAITSVVEIVGGERRTWRLSGRPIFWLND